MTFYFKPPRGNISLDKLEECISERIQYLSFIETVGDISCCENSSFKFEYLTDGSALDRTGHFMLRMLSSKEENLKEFILRAETLLFEKRLLCSSVDQIKSELRTAFRHAREILLSCSPLLPFKEFLSNFSTVCSTLLVGDSMSHSFDQNHSGACDQLSVKVPFTLCLDLTASRAVDLSNGFASVPCGKWSQLLASLFLEHMKRGLQQFHSSSSFKSVWFDERVKHVARTLKFSMKRLPLPLQLKDDNISCQNVDVKSIHFPPCMSNMHSTLRLRHRLTHNSRFYYSLFLKDIGMPLIESVEFWSKEYSQPHLACTSCSHSWQKDGRRYLYSIRHMYGLEGSRRGYQSHSCRQIQCLSLGPTSEGGCPFVHFDSKRLLLTLHQDVTSDKEATESILRMSVDSPSRACHFYYEALERICAQTNNQEVAWSGNKNIFKKPAEFYISLISRLGK